MFKKPPYPIYVADVQKMSVPRLSFRSPPLKIKIRKPPQHKPLPEPIPDIESQELPPAPKSNNKIMYFVIIIILLVSLRIISMVVFKTKKHTIKKLKCNQKQRTLSCYGAQADGTFVIQIPHSCSGSIYDIGGYPFSVALDGEFFKVPAHHLTVKDMNGQCEVKAYIDSKVMEITYPFTWITTNQHTTFTLLDGNDIIVDKAPVSMFSMVKRGPWVAYSYDIPGKTAKVIGDGTDIIHVYNGVLK